MSHVDCLEVIICLILLGPYLIFGILFGIAYLLIKGGK